MSATLQLAKNTELWLGKANSCAVSAVKVPHSSCTARLLGAAWKRRQGGRGRNKLVQTKDVTICRICTGYVRAQLG